MENQNLSNQLKQEDNSLMKIVSSNLAKIAGLKSLGINKETYQIWYEQIQFDLRNNKIKNIQKGFDNLLQEKAYGGLDYAVFFDGAKINKEKDTEEKWLECLESVKNGGRKVISARSAKALNSLGGMIWLRNADPEQINWQRKEFIEIYNNTLEPYDIDFRCDGLEAKIYLEKDMQNLLEA